MAKQTFRELLEQAKNKPDNTAKEEVKETVKEKEEGKEKEEVKEKEKSKAKDQVLTKNDYDAFECMSALQKSIRRGLEAEAMFWALELEGLNPSWLWKRLMIITTEDIGPADPHMPVLIKTLWDTYNSMKEMAKGKAPECHILGHAVLVLCRAKKSHESMYLPMTVSWWRRYLDWRIEIPDWALDLHTRRGKKKGRGRNHWYSEGFRLFNKATIEDDKWSDAFRVGDEIKYDLHEADDYYFHDHKGEYHHTEEDNSIDPETGLPKIGTYDKDKV